jgi:hypothetical protein
MPFLIAFLIAGWSANRKLTMGSADFRVARDAAGIHRFVLDPMV